MWLKNRFRTKGLGWYYYMLVVNSVHAYSWSDQFKQTFNSEWPKKKAIRNKPAQLYYMYCNYIIIYTDF